MKTTAGWTPSWMLGIYRWLLRLYPRAFRDTFGDELLGVVAQSLREAGEQGAWALWTVFFREVMDMAPNLLREYFSNQSLDRLVERMLTHRQHSRWRQAGALGFALGFALMELVSRLGGLLPTPPGVAFPGPAIHISVLNQPDGSLEITSFHGVGLLMLLACGLIAGLLLNRAEKPASSLWLPLVTAASLGGAYALLYAINLALWSMQIHSMFPYVLFNLINPFLFGGLTALGLGLYLRRIGAAPGPKPPGRFGPPMLRIFYAGAGGIFLGGLAGWVVVVAVSLVDWIERSIERIAQHQATFPNTGLISSAWIYPVLVGVLFSAVQGWVYGAAAGEAISEGAAAQVTSPAAKPGSDLLAKIVIAVLVVIVMASLVMLAVNTARQG